MSFARPAKPKRASAQPRQLPAVPVRPPRQRRRRLRRPALLPQPDHRQRRRVSRGKQSIQRRPGPRQRRIFRARAQKRTLTFTQLGIFRKDDSFKVVFNPSPDKPEKRILGPAPSCHETRRSTGVKLTQPRRQPATKLIHSIGGSRIPSISLLVCVGTAAPGCPAERSSAGFRCRHDPNPASEALPRASARATYRSHSANAFGVDTPTSGVTTTQAIAGKSGSG